MSVFLGGVVLLACHDALGAGFKVTNVHTRVRDGVYLLDADIDVDFGADSVEALKSGVPLTVVVDMIIVEKRALVWDKEVAHIRSQRRIEMHALSSQYLLKNLNSGATRAYRDLRDATAALGTIRNFPMIDSHLLHGRATYGLKLRAGLDIEALPSPMRPMAYLDALWHPARWSPWPLQR